MTGYFGLAVSSAGITYAIWGEADGSSIYCCGDTWSAHSLDIAALALVFVIGVAVTAKIFRWE